MLNQLLILDSAEKVAATLSNSLPGACPVIEFRQIQEALEGGAYGDTMSLTVPAAHPDSANVVIGNHVLFKDADGYWQEYRIINAQSVDGAQRIITATGEHAFYELLGEFLDDIRPTNATALTAVTQALANTRWQLGTADSLGNNTVRIYKTSVLSGLVQIAAQWGGELRFRLNVVGGVIANRYVDLLARRGAVTGKRFEMKKDLLEVKQTINRQNLVSALIGRGKGIEVKGGTADDPAYGRRLEFTDVVWTTPKNPVTKPAGQNWVGDAAVAAAYGPGGRHIKDVINFDDCTDAATLLQLTYNELQVRKVPQATYEMSVITLEDLAGYAHEAVRLGDTVNIINSSVTPAITGQARVILLDRNLMDPRDCAVTLGNYTPSITRAMADLQAQQQAMRDRAGVWDRATAFDLNTTGGGSLTYALDLLRTQLSSTVSGVSTDPNGNIMIENGTKTAALKLGGGIFAIANTKTGGAYNWTTFGDGNGFTAALINTGYLLANRIRGGTLTLGGLDNISGEQELLDQNGNVIGRLNKDGLWLDKGAIQIGTLGSSFYMNVENDMLQIWSADTTKSTLLGTDSVQGQHGSAIWGLQAWEDEDGSVITFTTTAAVTQWYATLVNLNGDMTVNGNQVWHEGNLDPTGYLPLTGGTLTNALHVVKNQYHYTNLSIPTVADLLKFVLLLHEIYDGVNLIDANYCKGTISYWRGTATNYLRDTTVIADTSSGYTGTYGTILSSGDFDATLVTCNYGGKKYLAIQVAYSSARMMYCNFTGFAKSTATLLTNIAYYNAQTSTVLNAEINGSITPYAAGTHTINGNMIWHEGNDGSGSGLDADKIEGFHIQKGSGTTSATPEADTTVTLTGFSAAPTVICTPKLTTVGAISVKTNSVAAGSFKVRSGTASVPFDWIAIGV